MDFVHVYWGLEGIYHLSACDTSHLRVTTSNEKRKKQADPARNRNKVYSLYMFVNLHVLLYIFVWCIRVFILVLFQASWSCFEPLGRTTKSFMPVQRSLLLKADKCHPQSACTEIIMRGTSEHVTALYHSDIPFWVQNITVIGPASSDGHRVARGPSQTQIGN